jgi:hypothetical protein
VIKKDSKAEWTTVLGFGGVSAKSTLMGAVGSFLTMAVILTVLAAECSSSAS